MGLIALKIIVIIVVALLFIMVAYKTSKASSGGKAFLYIIIELAIFFAIGFGAQWAVTQSFIKIKLTKFRNTAIPSSERLAVKGCVRNVGSYRASKVTLHVKVINNASGGSFAKGGDDRPQKKKYTIVVAKNLAKGRTKCFNKSFKYPPYFRLANIKAHISAN